jgi:1-acyl-sn-glycerol-3-phosphate acyltransferase
MDTPAVMSALPGRMASRLAVAAAADKFYASRRKWAWRYSLLLNTFPVHRGGGVKQLEYPLSLLQRGWSVLIFPEGARLAGRARLPAIKAQSRRSWRCRPDVPVIPHLHRGSTRHHMPKGQRVPRPGPVTARISPPVNRWHVAASVRRGDAAPRGRHARPGRHGASPRRYSGGRLAGCPNAGNRS